MKIVISDAQAKNFAQNIYMDIAEYIDDHKAEFEVFLNKEIRVGEMIEKFKKETVSKKAI